MSNYAQNYALILKKIQKNSLLHAFYLYLLLKKVKTKKEVLTYYKFTF